MLYLNGIPPIYKIDVWTQKSMIDYLKDILQILLIHNWALIKMDARRIAVGAFSEWVGEA